MKSEAVRGIYQTKVSTTPWYWLEWRTLRNSHWLDRFGYPGQHGQNEGANQYQGLMDTWAVGRHL